MIDTLRVDGEIRTELEALQPQLSQDVARLRARENLDAPSFPPALCTRDHNHELLQVTHLRKTRGGMYTCLCSRQPKILTAMPAGAADGRPHRAWILRIMRDRRSHRLARAERAGVRGGPRMLGRAKSVLVAITQNSRHELSPVKARNLVGHPLLSRIILVGSGTGSSVSRLYGNKPQDAAVCHMM